MKTDARLLHDLRAPLARAQTYAKLLAEDQPRDASLLEELLRALEELDRLLRNAEQGGT